MFLDCATGWPKVGVKHRVLIPGATVERCQLSPLDGSSWNQYAMLEADLGRTGRAIEKLQKALALDPDLPEGDLKLATLFVREAQMEPAETALKRALSIDPYDAAAYDLM